MKIPPMLFHPALPLLASLAVLSAPVSGQADSLPRPPPRLPGIDEAVRARIEAGDVPGAVTFVAAGDRVLHLEAHGLADLDKQAPMRADSIFRIASMTKPVTALAVLMLHDEGRLDIDDPVSKHLPEFASLKTPSGKPATVTIRQLLAHVSGLGGLSKEETRNNPSRTLGQFAAIYPSLPMQSEPGAKWKYNRVGLNLAARIVEITGGMPFDQFIQERIFAPLGMRDTTFHPPPENRPRIVSAYYKHKETGRLTARRLRNDYTRSERPPTGDGGLYSTAPDYGRLCRMLLNEGALDGKRYLRAETVRLMRSNQTGGLAAGFLPGHNWGVGVGIVREPQGVTAMLSPGTFGHGGAYGTQAWIDPARGVVYILMIQRNDFPNGDDSAIRNAFQQTAAAALPAGLR
ncbi:MAG: beta-lactamase family protein [Opitutaceae bacterium]|jgi:CubicO group peptidase (beta-lactamase class C family)|nr:beta-lactamase family protein [Opitutaceae bacterium]